jgi:ribonuclease R
MLVIRKAHVYQIVYTHKNESDVFEILDLKTGLPTNAKMEGMDLKAFKMGTVLKVDSETEEVIEVFGHLGDPKVL